MTGSDCSSQIVHDEKSCIGSSWRCEPASAVAAAATQPTVLLLSAHVFQMQLALNFGGQWLCRVRELRHIYIQTKASLKCDDLEHVPPPSSLIFIFCVLCDLN